MNLSSDLLSQFAKITRDKQETKTEKTVYGTTVSNGSSMFVQIDGSETLIPLNSTADVKANERVTVMIKDRSAIVTGNLSSPSARTDDVQELDAEVSEQKTILNNITVDNAYIKEELKANKADIENLQSENVTITGQLKANKAEIDDLKANSITTDELNANYANIDFSNIGKAAMEHLYATSGLIKDVVIGDASITGKLVGVTISGDLIEGNTIVAEKLVFKGSDGLYYKLNTDGMTTEAEQTDENSINGQVIKAKSITATKIDVSDLVAFNATIGGFKMTENSIYSGVKESVDNTTQGLYLDSYGQISIGDNSNFIKYYKTDDGQFKLDISAENITLTSKGEESIGEKIDNIQESLDSVQAIADSNEARVTVSESTIKQLSDSISMLITDESGSSMMTQTSDGWTFNIGSIEKTISNATDELNSLSGKVDEANDAIINLNSLANDLGAKTAYIVMTTDEAGDPCIELGKQDNDFKVRITNTSVDFMEGTSKIAYISNKSLYIERSIIKDELQIGDGEGYIWKRRSNGNMGLRWTGGV